MLVADKVSLSIDNDHAIIRYWFDYRRMEIGDEQFAFASPFHLFPVFQRPNDHRNRLVVLFDPSYNIKQVIKCFFPSLTFNIDHVLALITQFLNHLLLEIMLLIIKECEVDGWLRVSPQLIINVFNRTEAAILRYHHGLNFPLDALS
ncbi:hypothetical protein D3C75_811070 [compost metagenome]